MQLQQPGGLGGEKAPARGRTSATVAPMEGATVTVPPEPQSLSSLSEETHVTMVESVNNIGMFSSLLYVWGCFLLWGEEARYLLKVCFILRNADLHLAPASDGHAAVCVCVCLLPGLDSPQQGAQENKDKDVLMGRLGHKRKFFQAQQSSRGEPPRRRLCPPRTDQGREPIPAARATTSRRRKHATGLWDFDRELDKIPKMKRHKRSGCQPYGYVPVVHDTMD